MEMNGGKVRKSDVELGEFDQSLLSSKELNIMVDEKKQEYSMYGVILYRAALQGDWETAQQIQREHPNCFIEKISKYGDNALHIASAARQSYFVAQALEQAMITADQLELENSAGNTAFTLAAASGALEIVLEMERRNSKLPYYQGSNDLRPIDMAALLGHREMVVHLLPTFPHLAKDERTNVIISTINTELYDVALEIFGMDASLAIARNESGETPLHVLARKPRKQGRGLLQNTWLCFSSLFGEEYARVQLIERLWDHIISQSVTVISDILSSPHPRLLFSAIEMGNYEFVTILIQGYPDLIWEIDEEHRTIFHAAVKFRQERIFAHIFDINGIGHLLTAQKELVTGNNILHLAATLPPEDKLNLLPGPALQLQRELLWFQVVQDYMSPEYVNLKNNYGETPQALFIKEHKELRNEGEKWIRKTSISSMMLATIVAIIVFQAIFQLPKNNPTPSSSSSSSSSSSLVLQLYSYSLLASMGSILTFVTILSSRFAQEDFLISLPIKLMVGLVLLFISIGTMLAASTTTVLTNFEDQEGWMVIVTLAWVICIFYIKQYTPLMVDIICSTFGYRYLFWSRCQWF